MRGQVARAEALIAKIAEPQYGVVSLGQLRDAGIGEDAIGRRVRAGHLHRVHRGVYAVGRAGLSAEGRWLAAVLAVGRGPGSDGGAVLNYWRAALSHRSAASLWAFLPVTERPADVIVRGYGGRARRHGIVVHRSCTLVPRDVTLRRGIAVTTPARTISDLREATKAGRPDALNERELRRAIRQANVLGLPTGGERDRTRSDLEGDFLLICSGHGLPAPDVNVRIGQHLVDFLWRDRRLIVETDSYLYHRGQIAFQDDRDRDLDLIGLGYEVVRLSEKQVNEEPILVAETLALALRRRSPGP